MLLVNFIYYHILELTSKYTADHITPLSAKLAKYSASCMFTSESTQRKWNLVLFSCPRFLFESNFIIIHKLANMCSFDIAQYEC